MLRAQNAFVDRSTEAIGLAEDAATKAEHEGRADIGCEALLIAGAAARRTDINRAKRDLSEAAARSRQHHLQVWEVRAWAELGTLDVMSDSDATRLEQARKLATAAGMVGTVADIDMRIGQAILMRQGYVAAYGAFLRAFASARQLRLSSLQAPPL